MALRDSVTRRVRRGRRVRGAADPPAPASTLPAPRCFRNRAAGRCRYRLLWATEFRDGVLSVRPEAAARLGKNLDAALDRPLPPPVGFKYLKGHVADHAANALARFYDVRQARNERACGH